MQIRNMMAKKN